MEIVETVETVETGETGETVETVETEDCRGILLYHVRIVQCYIHLKWRFF